MMDFLSFSRAHGLIIDSLPPVGRWARYPTDDHPRKKNGAVKYLGDCGFVQNHATMPEPATWFPEHESDIRIDMRTVKAAQERAAALLVMNRLKAAQKAAQIIAESTLEQHAYLDSKGFPEARILVYRPSEDINLAVIPMYADGGLCGVQLIDRDGGKKFLFGQRCAGAEFVIGNRGLDVWCEGYATALSIQASLKTASRIHVCFSAGNLSVMAKQGFVVADHDISGTGSAAAQKTGLPFFLPPDPDCDFNDLMLKVGRVKAGLMLMEAIRNR